MGRSQSLPPTRFRSTLTHTKADPSDAGLKCHRHEGVWHTSRENALNRLRCSVHYDFHCCGPTIRADWICELATVWRLVQRLDKESGTRGNWPSLFLPATWMANTSRS